MMSCINEQETTEIILGDYIEKKERQFEQQDKRESLMFWQAFLSGEKSDFDKLAAMSAEFQKSDGLSEESFQIDKFKRIDQKYLSDEEDLDFLRRMKGSGIIQDSILLRQLDIIYMRILDGKFDKDKYKKLIALKMSIIQYLQNYQLVIDGEKMSDSQIDSLLKYSGNSKIYKKVFDSKRDLVSTVYDKCIELIRLRNDFAKDCGYANYYDFMLEVHEIKRADIDRVMLELDTISHEGYESAKEVLDKFLGRRFGLNNDQIKPWHYVDERHQFYPIKFTDIIDSHVSEKDVIEISKDFYDECGLNIQEILDNSLINSPEVNSQMNVFLPIEPGVDMRMMVNIQNDFEGLRTMMYLCSQAAYFNNIPTDLPFSLVFPNPIIYQGIGAFFTNDILHFEWLNEFVGIAPKDKAKLEVICRHAYQIEKLLESRHMLLMATFEREMYQNPDQDLSKLWWDLNAKFLGFKQPQKIYEYDWAMNDHFLFMAGTSHTKLFAELFAAQLSNTLISEFETFKNDSLAMSKNQFIGEFLKINVFKYGNVLPWNTLIRQATQENLKAKYYYESIVNIE